jgi:hypothetical protein
VVCLKDDCGEPATGPKYRGTIPMGDTGSIGKLEKSCSSVSVRAVFCEAVSVRAVFCEAVFCEGWLCDAAEDV